MGTKMGAVPASVTDSREESHEAACSRQDSISARGLSDELRAYILKKGADLVGFGSIDRLEGAPELHRPQRYLPSTRSVISIGLRINDAVCDMIARCTWKKEDPPSYNSFQLFSLAIINPQLDEIAYQGAKFLESRGYKAYPFPANLPHVLKPSPAYPNGFGDVSHKHIAVACGIGQIGWHTILLTPQFGSRQKLTTIATNAPLVADPMIEGKLCEPEKCGFLCARSCPTEAIPNTTEKKVSIKIGDQPVEYGDIVGWRCRWGCSGMLKCTGGYRDVPMPAEEPSDDVLMRNYARMDPWQTRVTNLTGLVPYCGRCFSVCPEPRGTRVMRGA